MARNRKYQSAAIRFGPALKAILLCLFIAGSGIGYVWQKNQIDELGNQIKRKELRLSDLQRQNKSGLRTLSDLSSPKWLDGQVKELRLGLGLPQQSQIRTLIEPPPVTESTNATERLYAERQAR